VERNRTVDLPITKVRVGSSTRDRTTDRNPPEDGQPLAAPRLDLNMNYAASRALLAIVRVRTAAMEGMPANALPITRAFVSKSCFRGTAQCSPA